MGMTRSPPYRCLSRSSCTNRRSRASICRRTAMRSSRPATRLYESCLPWATHDYSIYPYWDDLYLVNSGFGIFTSTSGTAPNRIFNIEWRSQYFPGSGSANFEVRLYEGQGRFDVIYGKRGHGQHECDGRSSEERYDHYAVLLQRLGGAATGGQSYMLQGCGTPTPTPQRRPSCTPIRSTCSSPVFSTTRSAQLSLQSELS